MNKLNLKKLLTLLVCLTLIVSVVLLAACNKKDDNKGSTEDNTSASPSFTNGNFRSYTTSDSGYPYAPSSFTGSPTSDTEGSTLPKLETVKRGVINLADYQNLGAWCTFSKFDAKRLTDEEDAKNYNKDDNVLMINNTEARYYMYRSSEFSVAANTKYLLQVDVRTANLNGGEKKGATIKIAKSYSSGSLIPATEGYASFDVITVGEWTTYSFIIDGKYNGSTSLELQLMLGNNNLRDEYKTSGYAFFDNIRLTTVKDDTVLPTENVKTITLSVPNGSFDYKTTSDYPYLYNRITTTDTNSNYGLVNEFGAKDENGKITLVGEYKIDADALKDHGNVFAIYNVAEARMGFYTTNPLYFKRGGYYKVTISLNTDNVESGKAYLALGKSKDLSDNTVIEIGKDAANPGWKEHVFYVYANENTADELYFHFGLGKDSGDKATGYILVDDLKIEETDDTTQTGNYVTDNRFKPADNKLTEAFVNKSGTDINGVPVTITGDGEEFSADDKTPYVSTNFSERNRKFTSAKATLAKFQTKATLQKDTYYRFSVWVRTVDVPSTSGVVLTIYDGDIIDKNSAAKAIATFAAVTTDKDLADSSSSLNGYRELVCYFHTASLQNQEVTFEISLGSGGAFTSSTLFSGTAYIANASLVETDYTKYNGASASGTYEKKYDWYETLSSETFTNGQFQKYNYSDTKFFKDGGKDSSNTDAVFQSTSFGVPSGWTLKGEKDKAVAGIVDVNRENLLNNLATKLGVPVDTLKTAPFECKEEDVETFGIYAGGDSYLLINSADVEGLAKESVRVGYVSNSFTLNANSYYKISVMVKVMGDSKASVYLMTDNNIAETNVDSKFENIEASTGDKTGGWKRYTFYVKTGFSSISATLGLYLGGKDVDIALTDANMVLADGLNGKYVKVDGAYEVYNKNTHKDATETYNYKDSAKGGTVLFDYVIKEDISESVYNAKTASATASAADEYEETKRVEMNLDSFGLATTPDENKPTSPKGWTKTSLTKDTDTEQLQSGVIYSTDYKAHSGESCLIIPYLNTAGASYYASDAKTLTKDGFYKISVWAKLSEGHTGKAYITLVATNYGENSKYVDYASQTIEVNSTEWKEYVFFIKAPSSDTKIDKYGENAKDLSLKIRLGFGESADNKASGYVLFDDVLIEKLDVKADDFDKLVDDFKAEPANAGLTVNTVKYSAIDKEEETTPDKEPDKENNKDSGKNFNWVIFTSVAFGAIVVIAVAAFFIKKYLPKHKEGKQQVDKKKTSKKKEDDYKNLND